MFVIRNLNERVCNTFCKIIVFMRYSGTCCNPSVYVNVVDDDGYNGRCEFNFGDPSNIKRVQVI